MGPAGGGGGPGWTNFFVISLFLPSLTHNLAMLWIVTSVYDNFLIFCAALLPHGWDIVLFDQLVLVIPPDKLGGQDGEEMQGWLSDHTLIPDMSLTAPPHIKFNTLLPHYANSMSQILLPECVISATHMLNLWQFFTTCPALLSKSEGSYFAITVFKWILSVSCVYPECIYWVWLSVNKII